MAFLASPSSSPAPSTGTSSPALSSTTAFSSPPTSFRSSGPSVQPVSTPDVYLSESNGRQAGLFTARPLRRGERILCEEPLLALDSPATLPEALLRLSVEDRTAFYELANAYEGDPRSSRERGIFDTNAFSLSPEIRFSSSGPSPASFGIFRITSRFNHSCRPNVRTSYHPSSRSMQVHVLTDVAAREELFTTYLGRQNLYGLNTDTRKMRLKRGWGFDCSCPVCLLLPAEQEASDSRRSELAGLRAGLPGLRPIDAEKVLLHCGRARDLLEAEGLFLDSDEFTSVAAKVCAWHKDWASAKVWAELARTSASAEYGERSELASRLAEGVKDPKRLLPAGVGGDKRDLGRCPDNYTPLFG
ncbi:hypothetical protein JCM10213v2_007393 [Rhodosporidiobolus nylandii]